MKERRGRLRQQIQVGCLAWPEVQDVINDARAHDLTVEEHLSGWLVRSGWLVFTGGEKELRRIETRLRALGEEEDSNVTPPARTGIEFLDFYLEQLEHQSTCGRGVVPQWSVLGNGLMQPGRLCIGCLENRRTRELWEEGEPQRRYAWAVPNQEALAVIADLSPNGVVEIGAGAGYWAMELRRLGVDVVAYDPWPPGVPRPRVSDEGDWPGYHAGKAWSEVLQGDHTVVTRHPDRTLLMCWPSYAERWPATAVELYQGDTVIYIGEGPGGCTADDRFHALIGQQGVCWHTDDNGDETTCPLGCVGATPPLFRETHVVDIPQWAGLHDRLSVHERIRADE